MLDNTNGLLAYDPMPHRLTMGLPYQAYGQTGVSWPATMRHARCTIARSIARRNLPIWKVATLSEYRVELKKDR